MIDLNKYRIIDLSFEMIPGEQKIDGRHLHGVPTFDRPVEVQEFTAYGARMHFIQSQTHNGTHAEGTYKYAEEGPDMAGMPVASYLGEAVVGDFSAKGVGEAIEPADLIRAGVRAGDIVLARGSTATADEPPYFTEAAVDWLIETGIKLFGLEHLLHSPPGTPYGRGDADSKLLLAGIPIIDALCGLEQIQKERVFFIALPLKMRRVTATWTRAIALEEID